MSAPVAPVAPVAARPAGPFAALRYRDYALFWGAALVSNSGSWMQSITVPYVIFQLTHSTTWVGFAAFMAFAPALAVGPLAGSLADRFPRKRVVLATQTVMMGVAFSLWALWATGTATPWLLVANLLVSGIASGINIASWQSFVPQLVPTESMLNAIRLNSMQFTAARAFGPALAGLVLARFGPSAAFLANALSFLVVIAALLAIHPRAVSVPADAGGFVEHFRDGLAYVRRRTSLVLPVVTITALSFFGSSVIQLAAPLAREVFHVGKAQYGFLVASFGVGAIFGSLFTLAFGDRIARSTAALAGLLLFGGGEALLGAAPTYGLGLAGLFTMGFAYLLVAVSLNTSVQARVDESHRGRVLSIYLMGLLAGVPFGALLAGAVADVIGLRATVVGAAGALLGFAALAAVRFDALRPLDESVEDEARAAVMPVDPGLGPQPAVPGAD